MIQRILFLMLVVAALPFSVQAQSISGTNPTFTTIGDPVALTITGAGTNFIAATGVYIRKPGPNGAFYPSGSFTINSSNSIVANFSVPANAPVGDYNVGVYDNTELAGGLRLDIGPNSNYGFISGYVNHDYNNNCTIDAGEPPLANRVVRIGNNQTVATDANGYYSIWTLLGNYNLFTAPQPSETGIGCNTASVSLVNPMDSANNVNLFFDTLTNPDLKLEIATWFFRPGFGVIIDALVTNQGYGSSAPTQAFFTYPASAFTGLSFPGASSVNGDTVFFAVPALPPGGIMGVGSIGGSLLTTIPLGTGLGFYGCVDPVAGELTSSNNCFSTTSLVRGSFDPNDKRVWNEQGDWADGYIDPLDSVLRYMIRFQNTGTDTAFNVFLEDTLAPNLDVSTLRVESASHPYTMAITGSANIKWTFADILLVDSTTNEPGSHGYLSYTIKRQSGLPIGTQIDNTAAIYFDFNAPVITNTVESVICPRVHPGFSGSVNGQSITLTDSTPGTVSVYLWDFGDGNSSSSPNPVHSYANPGFYNVCLYVTNSCGRTDSTCQIFTINCSSASSAFSSSVSGVSVDFTDLSSNSPSTWNWDFGDGNSSSLQSPTHSYSNTGAYTVCLTVDNGCGPDSSCQTVTISCVPPSSSFAFSASGSTVNFIDLSSGTPSQWLWDFGDGNTSSLQFPNHTYTTSGNFLTCLIVTSACGSDSFCQPIAGIVNVENGFAANLQVYPNPASHAVYIRYNDLLDDQLNLRLTDQLGRKVRQMELEAGSHLNHFNTSGLEPGAYFLEFSAGDRRHVQKLLVIEP